VGHTETVDEGGYNRGSNITSALAVLYDVERPGAFLAHYCQPLADTNPPPLPSTLYYPRSFLMLTPRISWTFRLACHQNPLPRIHISSISRR
jgi:hypothetical protein